ncbi:MAG: hypothetical protein A2284_15390 [Deltaproteobacteria bacterium RIFOXYA12_FULL_61_11]|nr:MAG: hypothetical protein A2284_15390 [Deltaproteobacteria bacterium RIFOXYA12_FULL_61_11]
MHVGVLRLRLRIDEAHSLKERRNVITRIRDKVAVRFKLSVADVSEGDLLNLATLGVTAVSNDRAILQRLLESVRGYVGQLFLAEIIDADIQVLAFDELSQW